MSLSWAVIRAHGGESLPIRDLPLPLGLTLAASAGVVAASVAVVAFRRARADQPERQLLGRVFATRALAGAKICGIALLFIFGFAAIARMTSDIEAVGLSLIPLAFWVGAVIGGILLTSIVDAIGDRSHENADDGEQPPVGGAQARVRQAIGLCLAPLLVYALFWFELVSGVGFSETWVFFVFLAYGGWMLAVHSPAGRRWGLTDPLSTLYRLASRAAPLRLTAEGLFYKGPTRDLVGTRPMPMALVGVVFVVLGATTLDNARETVAWKSAVSQLRLNDAPSRLVDSLALLLAAALFFLAFRAAVVMARRWIGRDRSVTDVVRRLSWSLIPIAIAYLLAHNLTLFVTGLPMGLSQLLDPIALGWDPFGLRQTLLSLVPSPGVIWFAQIVLVVGGHVLAVIAAHRTVVQLSRSREDLLWSLLPMTVLMTIYTVATLALLAQPLIPQ